MGLAGLATLLAFCRSPYKFINRKMRKAAKRTRESDIDDGNKMVDEHATEGEMLREVLRHLRAMDRPKENQSGNTSVEVFGDAAPDVEQNRGSQERGLRFNAVMANSEPNTDDRLFRKR